MPNKPVKIIMLTGYLGAGKTTLLKAAAGLLPHTGQCLLDGVPLESLSTRRLAQTVSYIPQQSGISVSLSAREVVLMGFNPRLGVLQSPTAAMRAAADEALRTVGLADKAGQDYLTLSGGEKQLCILARTIAEDAPLLLLDEPDSALDLANRSRMTALLAQQPDLQGVCFCWGPALPDPPDAGGAGNRCRAGHDPAAGRTRRHTGQPCAVRSGLFCCPPSPAGGQRWQRRAARPPAGDPPAAHPRRRAAGHRHPQRP